MQSPFAFSDTNKRYHTYDYYLKHRYNTKCIRVPIDAGFSCPNRSADGSGGCTFCSARGSGDFCSSVQLSPEKQFEQIYSRLSEKWGKGLPAIPYFQAFSGTYAPLAHLRSIYDEAPFYKDASGSSVRIPEIAIATRPDCLDVSNVSYLRDLSRRTGVSITVELGLQSAKDETLLRIRRGHTVADFLSAYRLLSDAGLSVCVHIINGLPGETISDMIETAQLVGTLHPAFIKIHMLHILRDTLMEKEYRIGDIPLMSMEEYTDTVCQQLRYLPPQTVIARLTGDGEAGALIAPLWTKNKRAVIASIDKTLAMHGIMQGDAYSASNR